MLRILSKFEVNSSNNKIFGFLTNALAIEIICLCPPDNSQPFVPILLSIPSFKLLIKVIFNNSIVSKTS